MFLNRFLDILLPRSCAGCGVRNEDFCLTCRTLAKHPRDEAFRADWLVSLWSYRDAHVKNAVHELKYRGRKPLAKVFAEALYDKLLEDVAEKEIFSGETFSEKYLLVPIPLSRERMRKRGFNQSELIAGNIARLAPDIFEHNAHTLVRIKNTEHQTLLKNREERMRNLEGSFAVKNQSAVLGKVIVLIDDVATTGATLMEARQTLLSAGAKRVYGATVAH